MKSISGRKSARLVERGLQLDQVERGGARDSRVELLRALSRLMVAEASETDLKGLEDPSQKFTGGRFPQHGFESAECLPGCLGEAVGWAR